MLDFGPACGNLPHPQHVVQVCMPLPSHHGQVTFRSAAQPQFSPLPLHVPHVRLKGETAWHPVATARRRVTSRCDGRWSRNESDTNR